MKINAIIQARMSATRLPGKVLLPACGKPLLQLLIERLRQSKRLNEIWTATTTNPADQAIVDLCDSIGAPSFRGSEENVLQRVVDCAVASKTDVILEMTGDQPLMDFRIIDQLIGVYLAGQYDYVSNVQKPTYPLGMCAQIFSTATLQKVNSLTKHPMDQEHVSLYIYKHPRIFSLHNVEYAARGPSYPNARLTLDTPQDYKLIKIIFEKLHPERPDFSLEDIYQFLHTNRELMEINRVIQQKSVDYYE